MKFCKKCDCETDRGGGGQCLPCGRSTAAAWAAANPERKKAAKAAYRSANPDKEKAYNKAWMTANAEKMKAYYAINSEKRRAANAAWKQANPEKYKAYAAAWRLANSERISAVQACWQAANAEAKQIHNQNRRAKKKQNGGVLSKGLSQKLFKLQKGKCACCKQPLGDNFHLDHIVPLALGGPNIDENMQLLIARCNLQKREKHPIDFMQSKSFLL